MGLFPDLLVAALQRAVALAEMDGLAGAVADHLHLDVARLFQIFLDVDGIVAEGRAGFGARRRERDSPGRPACAPPSCRGRRRRPTP